MMNLWFYGLKADQSKNVSTMEVYGTFSALMIGDNITRTQLFIKTIKLSISKFLKCFDMSKSGINEFTEK